MAKASKSTASHLPPPQSSATRAVQSLWKAYLDQTPDRLKFIDVFLVFIILSGVTQFLYLVLVTDFPFNAFLAGYVVNASRESLTNE
jgi:oligosaccharyltransferase complex subunit epsilon